MPATILKHQKGLCWVGQFVTCKTSQDNLLILKLEGSRPASVCQRTRFNLKHENQVDGCQNSTYDLQHYKRESWQKSSKARRAPETRSHQYYSCHLPAMESTADNDKALRAITPYFDTPDVLEPCIAITLSISSRNPGRGSKYARYFTRCLAAAVARGEI